MGAVLAMIGRRTFILGLVIMLTACTPTRFPLVDAMLPGDPSIASPSPRFAQLSREGAPALQVGIEDLDVAGVMRRDVTRNSFETWISQDNATVTLAQGMLVATRGFGGDMMGSDVSMSAAFVLDIRVGQATRFHSFLGGNDQVETRAYICAISSRGPRRLRIGNTVFDTRLMQEDCSNPDQRFTNLYWVDPGSGGIVQSRQWAGAFIGPLALRVIPK
jgi:hypothetical protein